MKYLLFDGVYDILYLVDTMWIYLIGNSYPFYFFLSCNHKNNTMKQRYLIACVLPFLFPYSAVLCEKSTEQYLQEGNSYLINGQYNDALISFDAAIRQEPDNYLSYFKRATAYLSLGRNNAAAEDFTTILNLKPGYDKALLQRARIYMKQGQYDLAKADLEKYLSAHKDDKEALTMVNIYKHVIYKSRVLIFIL